MIILTREFEPTAPTQTIDAPEGSRVVTVRMNQMGRGLAIIACPDGDDLVDVPIDLLVLFEEDDNAGGGDLAGWEHVAAWMLNQSRNAHCFAKYAAPAVAKKARPTRLTGSSK